MTRISSSTVLLRWFYALGMYGILAAVAFVAIFDDTLSKKPMLIPTLVGLAGVVFYATTIYYRHLVDEVFDCGDFLLVRKGGEEDQIALSNIWHVGELPSNGTRRIIIFLAHPGKFGAKIEFSPASVPFLAMRSKSQIAKILTERVEKLGIKHADGWSEKWGTDPEPPSVGKN